MCQVRISTQRCSPTLRSSLQTGICKAVRLICGKVWVSDVLASSWDNNKRGNTGYIAQDVFEPSGTNSKQVSRALEVPHRLPSHAVLADNCQKYAFDDFVISQVAKRLGRDVDAQKVCDQSGSDHIRDSCLLQYAHRATNFENLWQGNVTVPGGPQFVKGMMQVSITAHDLILPNSHVGLLTASFRKWDFRVYRPTPLQRKRPCTRDMLPECRKP